MTFTGYLKGEVSHLGGERAPGEKRGRKRDSFLPDNNVFVSYNSDAQNYIVKTILCPCVIRPGTKFIFSGPIRHLDSVSLLGFSHTSIFLKG